MEPYIKEIFSYMVLSFLFLITVENIILSGDWEAIDLSLLHKDQ